VIGDKGKSLQLTSQGGLAGESTDRRKEDDEVIVDWTWA